MQDKNLKINHVPPLRIRDYNETRTVFLSQISSENKRTGDFILQAEIIAF